MQKERERERSYKMNFLLSFSIITVLAWSEGVWRPSTREFNGIPSLFLLAPIHSFSSQPKMIFLTVLLAFFSSKSAASHFLPFPFFFLTRSNDNERPSKTGYKLSGWGKEKYYFLCCWSWGALSPPLLYFSSVAEPSDTTFSFSLSTAAHLQFFCNIFQTWFLPSRSSSKAREKLWWKLWGVLP